MTPEEPPTGDPASWSEAAEQVLDPLLRAQSLLALVSGAEAGGLLRAARTSATVGDLSTATGWSPQRVEDVVRALVASEVLDAAGQGYRLTPAWALLVGPTARAPLTQVLRAADVDARILRSPATSGGFGALPDEDRYAHAQSVSPDPFAPGVVAAFRSGAMTDPTVHRRLAAGARHLELGCGLAGHLLCLLQAYPRMTAVGVESAPDLAAEAGRRAEALGVAHRFEVMVGDAATVPVGSGFGTARWSQFFFAEDSRAGALRTLLHALDAGALLEAPLLGDPAATVTDPHGADARNLALVRVVHGSWGIPGRTPAQLADEVVLAGFVDVVTTSTPGGPARLLARRP